MFYEDVECTMRCVYIRYVPVQCVLHSSESSSQDEEAHELFPPSASYRSKNTWTNKQVDSEGRCVRCVVPTVLGKSQNANKSEIAKHRIARKYVCKLKIEARLVYLKIVTWWLLYPLKEKLIWLLDYSKTRTECITLVNGIDFWC